MKIIPIKTKNSYVYAKVDDVDYDWLSDLKWHMNGKYVAHTSNKVYMHHLVLLLKRPPTMSSGIQVDHINHDTLDNQSHNLRLVSARFNSTNKKVLPNKHSGFRGITKNRNMYTYYLNKKTTVAWFSNARHAALARELELRHIFRDAHDAFNFKPSEIVGGSFF